MTGAAIIKAPPPHPLADLPPMEGNEFDELVGDIHRRGLRVPIVTFEDKTLDGCNRGRACEKAGYSLRPEDIVRFEDKFRNVDEPDVQKDAARFVVTMNIHRRNLTPDTRKTFLKKLLSLHPEMSDRAIAAMAKTHHHAVADVRKEEEGRGNLSHAERRTDTKGRRQPARKAKPKGRIPGKPRSLALSGSPALATQVESTAKVAERKEFLKAQVTEVFDRVFDLAEERLDAKGTQALRACMNDLSRILEEALGGWR
jgi:hypothetical protein